MGVGESSMSRSVTELSNVLEEIERKLSAVESAQIHLENTAVRDGEIIVCDRRILCDPGTTLSIGPIVGLVTQTTARILVESARSTLLTLNVFISDELSATARFLYATDLRPIANKPCACTLTGLSPGYRYVVYVGGCTASETLSKVAQFSMLPPGDEQIRTIFVQSDSPTGSTSREADGWAGLHARCVGLTSMQAPHMVFHLGGFVSLDGILRSRGLQLFELASRDDVDDGALQHLLSQTEVDIQQAFRNAFQHEKCTVVLRCCGHLFLCGESEAALRTTVLLAIEAETVKSVATATIHPVPHSRGGSSKNDRRRDNKSNEAKGPPILTMEDEYTQDNEALGDFLAPAIGGVVRRDELSLREAVRKRLEIQDSTRKDIIGILLRMARRSYWAYMRQLWDEECLTLIERDLKDENVHRKSFFMNRNIERKSKLSAQLETTAKKLLREFGPEYVAAKQVTEQFNKFAAEIYEEQRILREFITDPANATGLFFHDTPPDHVFNLGILTIVIVDSNWNWLLPSGYLRETLLSSKEVSVHPSVFSALDKAVLEPNLRHVLLLSPTSLLPLIGQDGDPEGDNRDIASSFYLSASDRKWFLEAFARWQQEEIDRCACMAYASSFVSGSGWVAPLVTDDSDADAAGWNSERSKITQIAVGGLCVRPTSVFVFSDKRHIRGTSKSCRFESVLDFVTSELSFWVLSSVNLVPFDAITQENAKPACYQLSNIRYDNPVLNISVGPIVSKVSHKSASVVVESVKDGYVTAIACDQITGSASEITRYFSGGLVDVFHFEDLVPGRAYEVLLFPGNASATEKRLKLSKFRGTFTTPCSNNERSATKDILLQAKGPSKSKNVPIATSTSGYPFIRDFSSDCFRIILLGANRPLWTWNFVNTNIACTSVPPTVKSTSIVTNADLKDLNRLFLLEGSRLTSDVTEMCSRAWKESPDVVIHLGHNVDITSMLQKILSLLGDAERAREPNSRMAILDTALEAARDCYRLHWGASNSRQLLAHSSHLFVTCTMLDLISATNCAHLKGLEGDLSPFTVQKLHDIFSQTTMEYQSTPGTSAASVDYLCQGTICVFTLRPRLLSHVQGSNHDRDHYDDHLISEEQFDELEALLFDKKTSFKVLLVLSPLPILRGDPDSHNLSTRVEQRVNYRKSEILRLLDCLSLWLEYVDIQAENADDEEGSSIPDSGSNCKLPPPGRRQAAILTGGSNIGYRTIAEARRRVDRRGGSIAEVPPAATIQQICCGSFVSIPDSTPDTADDEDQSRTGTVTRDSNFVPRSRYDYIEYSYKLVHTDSVIRAHCGVVDIQSSSGDGPPRIVTSLPDRDTFRTLAFGYSRDLAFHRGFPPVIQSIWVSAAEILSVMESAGADSLPASCSDDLCEALSRVRDVYIANEWIIDRVHSHFCGNLYGLPTSGGRLVEDIFLSVTADLVRELHSSSKSLDTFLIRSPSPLIITMIWSDFRSTFDYSGSLSRSPGEQEPLLDQLATSALISSKNLFSSFALKLIYMPIIVEDLAYDEGLIFDEERR